MLQQFFLIYFTWLLLFSLGISAQEKEKRQLLCHQTLLFDSGSAELTEAERAKVLSLYECIKKDTSGQISLSLSGHTDTTGTDERNDTLSLNRAKTVAALLQAWGLDSSRMEVRGFGKYSPINLGRDAQSQAENRRVNVLVWVPYAAPTEEPFIEVRGRVLDAQTKKPLQARIDVFYLGGSDSLTCDSLGFYAFRLPRLAQFELRAKYKTYFFVSKILQTDTVKQRAELNFNLERALVGQRMALQHLYFQPGKPILLPASERALDGLYEFLLFNEDLVIEIGGHINRPLPLVIEGSPSFELSKKRAKAVFDYLSEKGISQIRLSYQGYGNSQPIYPEPKTSFQEQENRRVEIKVLN